MGEVCKCCGQKMPETPAPVAKIRDVLHAIERAGVAIEDVLARNMTHEVCVWRKAGYAAARQATGASYPKIGRAFRRDHTTIMVGERGAEPWRVQALLSWTAERVAERAGA